MNSFKHFKKNIVLIGMMGSGKTTIGKMISQKLYMGFVDSDEYIEKYTGTAISEIFKNGEEYFRQVETEAILKLSMLNSTVISTGGGTVKKDQNIMSLRENGIIFFIDRSIENIASDIEIQKRPLLSGGKNKIFEIFNERYELYKRSSDVIIKNDEKIEDAEKNIIESYLYFAQK